MAKKTKKPSKPAKQPRYEDEDIDDVEDFDEGDEPKKPRADIYVGLGFITLVLLITAAVLFYLDNEAAAAKPVPVVNVTVNALKLPGQTAPNN